MSLSMAAWVESLSLMEEFWKVPEETRQNHMQS